MAQIRTVNLDVSAPKTNLRKGESTSIHVVITGLENLKDTATLKLNNITPSTVTMQPSNNVVIFLAPDSVGSGTFNRQFDVRSIATGDFVVMLILICLTYLTSQLICMIYLKQEPKIKTIRSL